MQNTEASTNKNIYIILFIIFLTPILYLGNLKLTAYKKEETIRIEKLKRELAKPFTVSEQVWKDRQDYNMKGSIQKLFTYNNRKTNTTEWVVFNVNNVEFVNPHHIQEICSDFKFLFSKIDSIIKPIDVNTLKIMTQSKKHITFYYKAMPEEWNSYHCLNLNSNNGFVYEDNRQVLLLTDIFIH